MDEEAVAYRAYLLRIWRADNDGRPVWRFTLQPIGPGSPEVFCSAYELLSFLLSVYQKNGGHQ